MPNTSVSSICTLRIISLQHCEKVLNSNGKEEEEVEKKWRNVLFIILSVSIWLVCKLHRPFLMATIRLRKSSKTATVSIKKKRVPKLIFISIDGLLRRVHARKTHLQFNMLLSNILPFAFHAFVAAAVTPLLARKIPMKRQHRTKSSVTGMQMLRVKKMYLWMDGRDFGALAWVKISLTQFIDTFNFHQLKWNARERVRLLCCRQYSVRFIFYAGFFPGKVPIFKIWRKQRVDEKGSAAVDYYMINSSENFN